MDKDMKEILWYAGVALLGMLFLGPLLFVGIVKWSLYLVKAFGLP